MAAPNLITITTVIGRTRADWCTTTLSSILSNDLNTSELLRINSIFISNVGLAEAGVKLDFLRAGQSFYITLNNIVPVGTSTVLMAKETGIYLEEGDSLRISASANNTLQYVISYEVIS